MTPRRHGRRGSGARPGPPFEGTAMAPARRGARIQCCTACGLDATPSNVPTMTPVSGAVAIATEPSRAPSALAARWSPDAETRYAPAEPVDLLRTLAPL